MTKRGAGELRGIDTTTYSIPFCSVQLTDEGPHKYELVYVSATELRTTHKKEHIMTHNNTPLYNSNGDIDITARKDAMLARMKTTSQKLLLSDSIFKMGLENKLYSIISMYAREVSDYEIVLDGEVEDFTFKTGGV
jgi:hypothetical protein